MQAFSINLLGYLFEFFEPEHALKLGGVSTKFNRASQLEHLWKRMCVKEFVFCRKKPDEKSWMDTYLRKKKIVVNQGKGSSSNFAMVPLRSHKEVISAVDTVGNTVITGDESGTVIFWSLNPFPDADDDDKNEPEITILANVLSSVKVIKHVILEEDNHENPTVLVTIQDSQNKIHGYKIKEASVKVLDIVHWFTIQPPISNDLQVVLTKDRVIVTPNLINRYSPTEEKTAYVYDIKDLGGEKTVLNAALNIPLERSGIEVANSNPGNPFANNPNMIVNPLINPLIYRPQVHYNTLYPKEDIIAIIDEGSLFIAFPNRTIEKYSGNNYEHFFTTPQLDPAIGQIKQLFILGTFLYVITTSGIINIYNKNSLQLLHESKNLSNKNIHYFNAVAGIKGHTLIVFDSSIKSIHILRHKFSEKSSNHNVKFVKEINDSGKIDGHLSLAADIDNNEFYIVTGSSDNSFAVWNNKTGEKMFTLPGGSLLSKAKSFKPHPSFKGIHLVRIVEDKVVIVLGNMSRVYCYDV